MKTASLYADAQVNACFSVIVELMTYLKKYGSHIILVGGWVPYFLYGEINEKSKKHVGSLDVDLALNFILIPEQDYQTIADILEERGYVNRKDRRGNIINASYERTFTDENNREHTVQVDFLASEYGGSSKNKRHQRIQEILARKGRGVDLVFENCVEREIEARMPNRAINKVKIKVADLCAIMVMKGFALQERGSEKDAYDIYWLIKNHPQGETGVIQELQNMKSNKLVSEALFYVRDTFEKVESIGPVAVANFLEPVSEEEREILTRDAFETVNRVMKMLEI
jgi:hypothetical protein